MPLKTTIAPSMLRHRFGCLPRKVFLFPLSLASCLSDLRPRRRLQATSGFLLNQQVRERKALFPAFLQSCSITAVLKYFTES